MKPEELAQKLRETLGDRLQSVILYGSAAAGDYVGKESDYNVLVVTTRLGVPELTALAPLAAAWKKKGNPAPLVFTLQRLQRSADVFPIELMDIQESHRVLFGDDVVSSVEVDRDNLRLILERELKSTLIQLREAFLLTEARPRRVASLMIESLSTVLVLFRASLRLFQPQVPPTKIEAMKALKSHIDFDDEVFLRIEDMKEERIRIRDVEPVSLFATYLETIESVADKVDAHIHSAAG